MQARTLALQSVCFLQQNDLLQIRAIGIGEVLAVRPGELLERRVVGFLDELRLLLAQRLPPKTRHRISIDERLAVRFPVAGLVPHERIVARASRP